MSERPHVVIIGAGFGGLAAAKRLEKAPVDVTVIDKHNYHTFQPLLYQVATCGLNAADVGYPARGMFRKKKEVKFRTGLVTSIDWSKKRVLLDEEDPISYDYLILAAGSTTNFFGTPGAEENAYPLYTLPDALHLRNHVLSLFEASDAVHGLIEEGSLNFVVVGGGATGVEVSGALIELINKVLVDDFHDMDTDRAKVILVEMGDCLLAPFDPKLQEYAKKTLTKRGVEIRLGTAVSKIHPDHVELGDGSTIKTRLVIWAAGVAASSLTADLKVEEGHGGRVEVGPDLRINGMADCFAIGDVAQTSDGKGGYLPQLAQPAIQGGKHAAEQILRLIGGAKTEDFSYFDKGIMATIGRKAAVAQLPKGPKLTGRLAWFSWLFLHLIYLAGFRNRISVMLNWFWNYLTWERGPRIIISTEAVPQVLDHAPDAIPKQAEPKND